MVESKNYPKTVRSSTTSSLCSCGIQLYFLTVK